MTEELQKKGYTVLNAPNPLRGLASDAANVVAFVNQHTTGPVVLVGHSYAGSVITEAAVETPTVTALVYINAYAPDVGENVLQLTSALPGSLLAVPDPSTVFDFVQYPGAAPGDVDTYIKPNLFREVLAADLSARQTKVLAAPAPHRAERAADASDRGSVEDDQELFFRWNCSDNAIPGAEQLAMAERAGGYITQADAGHLSMLEQPHKVAVLIEKAARAR